MTSRKKEAKLDQACEDIAFELEQHLDGHSLVVNNLHGYTRSVIATFFQDNRSELIKRIRKVKS